ncbi:MAG: HipA N-terminal domain-containing protein [Bacteroidetes bacterium]|nr:HipA N-terminal domain-containing protein [Bacteroidota bacterium]
MTLRSGIVRIASSDAGVIWEDEYGIHFRYESEWLGRPEADAVSLTLPLRQEAYHDENMLPFFDGLIPEGWLLDIAMKNWKLDVRDRMGLLLACCTDCIGAVSVHPVRDGDLLVPHSREVGDV